MLDKTYLSNADVMLVALTNPAVQPLLDDAPFFQLTQGRQPIHIWNYARTGEPVLDVSLTGEQGGAPFDDTALSHELVQLELILNARRLETLRQGIISMTEIGDVLILSRGKNPLRLVLKEGRVGQSAASVNLRGSTHPRLLIVFKGIDRVDAVQTPEQTAATTGLRYRFFTLRLRVDGTEVEYDASVDLPPSAEITVLPETLGSTVGVASSLSLSEYKGAILAVEQAGITRVYVWRKGGYVLVRQTRVPIQSLYGNGRLSDTDRIQSILTGDLDDREILWLARCIYSETKQAQTQLYVGWTIRHRVETGYRGKTSYKDVVLDPYQFFAFNQNNPRRNFYLTLDPEDGQPGFDQAYSIAVNVYLASSSEDPFIGYATDPLAVRHFFAPASMTGTPVMPWNGNVYPVPSWFTYPDDMSRIVQVPGYDSLDTIFVENIA
ncbi:MAG: hypothetical protein D6800_03215 [Candidatus Zixiibacteriota bacterium]|nr:MAG: hypothetical protein D6800_03215 [candidate division Zixibacteria bacterium]